MSADKYLRIFLSQMEAIVYFIQCRTFHIREGVIFFFWLFYFYFSFLYFGCVFKKKIIPLMLVGYEMITAKSELWALLTIYHLIQCELVE